jgi:hypothetical protein
VELQPFGMVGIGAIFDSYFAGRLSDDDEVAVLHGDAESNYRPLSDAMVDIRDVLDQAASAGVIDADTAHVLCDLAKSRWYGDRSVKHFATDTSQSAMSARERRAFLSFADEFGPRAKARDATAALRFVKRWLKLGIPKPTISYTVENTIFLERLQQRVNGRTNPP